MQLTDYKKFQLKVGIEVHQELATRHKLFCKCPPMLSQKDPEFTFIRKLRPSQSELGEIDPAALFESLKGKTFRYQADNNTNCLVELDEEPPGSIDGETLDVALTYALMVGSRPVDEVHVMRKTVVDGSNTGGFQRTCVVSLGGSIEVNGSRYGIQQISLEEDAARNVGEEGSIVLYRLDRLGIPLMEVSTEPDMHTPDEVHDVALRIGSLLRATGKAKRGIGTIRQDVNVSILGGRVVEIKGVQDLALLKTIVEYEAQRQSTLLEIMSDLSSRGVSPNSIKNDQFDVTFVFKNTECKIIRNAIKAGGVVKAVKLPEFKGLIGRELCPGRRLGTELSDLAKYKAGVKGIFHTDELPGYSITADEVEALRQAAKAKPNDAVVIVADDFVKSTKALDAVVERAREALNGITMDTRAANPDGTTRFTRPRPGAARMYPETDVQIVKITPEYLRTLEKNLPEMPEDKLARFQKVYGLNEKLARQITDSEFITLFEELAEIHRELRTLMAVTLTEDLKKLQRDGVNVDALTDDILKYIFEAIVKDAIVKESISEVITWLSKNPEKTVESAIEELKLNLMNEKDLEKFIDEKILSNRVLISKLGKKASGPLMGIVMRDLRGRAKASDVQRIINKKLNN